MHFILIKYIFEKNSVISISCLIFWHLTIKRFDYKPLSTMYFEHLQLNCGGLLYNLLKGIYTRYTESL